MGMRGYISGKSQATMLQVCNMYHFWYYENRPNLHLTVLLFATICSSCDYGIFILTFPWCLATYTMHCNSFDHYIRIKVVLYIPIFVTQHEKVRLMSTQNVTTFWDFEVWSYRYMYRCWYMDKRKVYCDIYMGRSILMGSPICIQVAHMCMGWQYTYGTAHTCMGKYLYGTEHIH